MKKKRSLQTYRPNMPVKLPVSSVSHNVQQQHIRVYEKPGERVKAVLVNKGNVQVQRIIPQAIVVKPKEVPVINLRPRTSEVKNDAWKSVLKADEKKAVDVQRQLLKDMEKSGVVLKPGERVAVKVISLEQTFAMDDKGNADFVIHIINDKGEKEDIPVKLNGSPQSKKFIKMVLNVYTRGEKLIFKETTDEGLTTYNVNLPGRTILTRPKIFMTGAKDLAYIKRFGSPMIQAPRNPDVYFAVTENPITGILTVYKKNPDGSVQLNRPKFFKSRAELLDAIQKSWTKETDAFGDRWDAQVELKDYEKEE